MRVIDLALKDLLQTVRDWRAAAFLVAMPILFTLLFGFLLRDANGDGDQRLPVGFVDQAGGGVLSTQLLRLLEGSDVIRPDVLEREDADDAESKVADEELAAVVIVPAGYSERVLAGDDVALLVIANPASSAGRTAQAGIQGAVTRLLGAAQTAQLSAQMLETEAGFSNPAARRAFVEETLRRAVDAWEEPPLTVAVSQSDAATKEDDEEGANSYAHASPSMMVQFTIAGLVASASILVLERKSRALRRLLTTAISRVEIILGHYLAMFVLVFLQLVLLVGFGQVALGVPYLREPLATLLIMVTMALFAASLGLLIGVLAKTQEQAVVFALIPMFILAALGGAWMPLESTSEAFQTIGHLTPTAWAMDGFKNIVLRGQGLGSVLRPAGILLGYAAAFFALAVSRFRFE
jgi:ABC-2 type transport system permease protein